MGLLTASAEDSSYSSVDGYAIPDSSFDEHFGDVVAKSDLESAFYDSSGNATYFSPAGVTASSESDDSSADVLYTYSTLRDFYINLADCNPAVYSYNPLVYYANYNSDGSATVSTYNKVTEFIWKNVNVNNRWDKLSPTRVYRISWDYSSPDRNVYWRISFFLGSGDKTLQLVSPFTVADSRHFSFDVTIPEDWLETVYFGVKLTTTTNPSCQIQLTNLTVSDITSADLDNSLGKFAQKIKGFFDVLADKISGFFDALAEKIKGFFIPSDGFFDEAKTKFNELLSAHLGFLYEAPVLVGNIFGVVKDWNPPEQPTITLPAFDFKIGEDQIHLWDEQVYTFDFLGEQPWITLYAFYKTFVFVLLSVAMVNLAIIKYHSIIDGGNEDDN